MLDSSKSLLKKKKKHKSKIDKNVYQTERAFISLLCKMCNSSLRMRKPQVLKKSAQIYFTLSNETLTYADRFQVAEEKKATC